MKGLITLLCLLLLVFAIPVHATNNSLPQGASVELSFSPSRIPLGSSSTLSITVGAEDTGTDLYVVVGIQFEDWLRWKASDIRMGNFLYGGVVFKTDNQLLGSSFLQIGVVVPKGNYISVQVPVTPTRTGIFYLNEVIVVTLPVINGNFVLTPDGYFYQGLTYSILQFANKLVVYDPLLPKILENQQQILDNQDKAVDLIQNGLAVLSTVLQTGLGDISNQNERQLATLTDQNTALQNQIEQKYQVLLHASYVLIALAGAVMGYLLWFTYRLSKSRV